MTPKQEYSDLCLAIDQVENEIGAAERRLTVLKARHEWLFKCLTAACAAVVAQDVEDGKWLIAQDGRA